jgi:para-aminobenzoate synthetase/4-amino-4-deoxychorismate lyase
MLASGRSHPRWSRWSVLAEPRDWLIVREAELPEDSPDPLATLTAVVARTRWPSQHAQEGGAAGEAPAESMAAAELPFLGGWIGSLGYELGRRIEPAVRGARGAGPRSALRPDGHAWPLIQFAHCPSALIHDRARQRWWSVGPRGETPLEESLRAELESPAETPVEQPRPPLVASDAARASAADRWRLAPFRTTVGAAEWQPMILQAIELIRAGDIYQANLTHLLRSMLLGSPRALALDALAGAAPWHGALLELPDGSALISLSPELYLSGQLGAAHQPSHVLTRPIKGTRPATHDPAELLDSGKDEAELTMIVDLMRNDLGRVCQPGSVEVSEPRHVEEHPTVHQGVATVQGALRPEVDLAALLRSTFPPGSVTGAPKIRAMQVIEALEPWARGPYCGAIGCISDHGRFSFNVAIRTLAAGPPQDGEARRHVLYGVGCGIVAESDPAAEWQESLDKAAVARALVEPVDAPDRTARDGDE